MFLLTVWLWCKPLKPEKNFGNWKTLERHKLQSIPHDLASHKDTKWENPGTVVINVSICLHEGTPIIWMTKCEVLQKNTLIFKEV